ncbi:hypothetical protein [Leptotrichia shahii]|jgi:hypothetical protein|uniref:hypothetical protein n=1 Tax=Leptotrichia shahii TaxID=157691 RepID=UPI0028D25F6F|nr:hypothetical protein [Leptotrichia shahii]
MKIKKLTVQKGSKKMNEKDSNFDGFLEILAARELKDSYKCKYEEKSNGEKFKIKKIDEPKSAKLINVSFALGKETGETITD